MVHHEKYVGTKIMSLKQKLQIDRIQREYTVIRVSDSFPKKGDNSFTLTELRIICTYIRYTPHRNWFQKQATQNDNKTIILTCP